ncbi:hypothetical protein [Verrucosispora sp. ts21]|uniref:hypothetical protein n=1 Tax=Verrucosispora sp. ts21 TaxID=2069341 RepID=UPI0011AEFB26|nr:hypothetical protein [Verrucosispora sp. ts21]
MASPDASSAPDGTAGPGGAPPPATPAEPEPRRAAQRGFTDRWRRLWRRQPDMSHLPVDLDHAVGLGLLTLVIGAISGTALILLIPSPPLCSCSWRSCRRTLNCTSRAYGIVGGPSGWAQRQGCPLAWA